MTPTNPHPAESTACKTCGKPFQPYQVNFADELYTEDRYCSAECAGRALLPKVESVEEAARNHVNKKYGTDDQSFIARLERQEGRDNFIAGSNWKETQLREENERLREEIQALRIAVGKSIPVEDIFLEGLNSALDKTASKNPTKL